MSIDPNSRYKQGPSGAGDWLMQFLGRGGRSNGPKGMENRAAGMRDYKAPNSTPWGERSGALGVNKGDWLQAGLGMLAGRNMQDGFYNVAGVAGNAMDRRRTEDKDEQRRMGILSAYQNAEKGGSLGKAMESVSMEDLPIVQGIYSERKADARYEGERDYNRGRDYTNDEWRQDGRELEAQRYDDTWNRQGDWRDEDNTYRGERDAVTDADTQTGFGLQREAINARHAATAGAAAGYRMATPEEVAKFGYDPDTVTGQISPKGEFKVQNTGPKPLLGAEAMAKAAAGLPNMRDAVSSLRKMMTPDAKAGIKGYRPGHDWGAKVLSGLPDFGLFEGPAKAWGGEDYQMFENNYNQFEAAAMPIMSGAAISESEARRTLNAIKIRMGDSPKIIQAKLQSMENMTDGLTAAANGDVDALRAIMSGIDKELGGDPEGGAIALDPEVEAILELYLFGDQ